MQNGTFVKACCSPLDNVMQAAIVVTNNIRAYIIREEVEFLHDGQAEQQSEHAVLVQQQANCAAEQRPRTAPIFIYNRAMIALYYL